MQVTQNLVDRQFVGQPDFGAMQSVNTRLRSESRFLTNWVGIPLCEKDAVIPAISTIVIIKCITNILLFVSDPPVLIRLHVAH